MDDDFFAACVKEKWKKFWSAIGRLGGPETAWKCIESMARGPNSDLRRWLVCGVLIKVHFSGDENSSKLPTQLGYEIDGKNERSSERRGQQQ